MGDRQIGLPGNADGRDAGRDRVRFLRVLTTHGNALGYLSGGFLFPVGSGMPDWARAKLYRDPGQLAPGYLVLFASGPGAEIASAFVETDDGQFPVMLEINPRFIDRPNAVIDLRGGVIPGQRAAHGDEFAWLVHGLIPTAAVTRLVFRSDEERRRFRAFRMGNFDPDAPGSEMTAEPQAFSRGGVDPRRFQEALRHAIDEIDAVAVPEQKARALAGAAALVAAVAERREDFPLARMKAFLDSLRAPAVAGTSDAPDLLALVPELLLPSSAAEREEDGRGIAGAGPFLAALASMAALEPKKFVPTALVEELIRSAKPEVLEHRGILQQFVDILDAIGGVDDLPSDVPDLLMALLDECRAAESLPALPSNRGSVASLEREVGAALLIGALLGRDRLPIPSQPTSKRLMDRIDGAVARRANDIAGAGGVLPDAPALRIDGESDQRERLLAGDHVMLEREATTARDLVRQGSQKFRGDVSLPAVEVDHEVWVRLCVAAGWTDLFGIDLPEPPAFSLRRLPGRQGRPLWVEGVAPSQVRLVVDQQAIVERLANPATNLEPVVDLGVR
jgi:hypothetical protein